MTAMSRELKSASAMATETVTQLVNKSVRLLSHQNRTRSHRRNLPALMALALAQRWLVPTKWAEGCIAGYKTSGPADHH